MGIRLPLDNLLNLESCRTEVVYHLVRSEKVEVNANPVTLPLIKMNGVVADVEGQQQRPARSQNSPKLAQRPHHVVPRTLDAGCY
jgi:hypothetical protein